MSNLILKRYSTYSNLQGLFINIEGNFPIYTPEEECSFLTKQEQTQIFIEKENILYSDKTCEQVGNLIDKKLFTIKPTSNDEEYSLTKIVYGNKELNCYECLP